MQLKITLYWHRYCHHYSFDHPYQQCEAHAVGGQSSHFHGAFLASPSTLTSPYPSHTLLWNPLLLLSPMIFHFASLDPFLLLFFLSLPLPAYLKPWWVTPNAMWRNEEKRRNGRGEHIPGDNLYFQNRHRRYNGINTDEITDETLEQNCKKWKYEMMKWQVNGAV